MGNSMPLFFHDGAELFFTDEGDGPPVLLLHGWACDSHDWSWQIPDLLAGHRVIALDQRGHGRSSAPVGSYRPQVLADDAAGLLRHLRAGPAFIVGHSMGTVVTSALSVRHPELVRALVLVDPVYSVPDAASAPIIATLRKPSPLAAAASMFEAAFYTDATAPHLPTWHRRRLLGTPEHVVTGCILGLYEGEEGIGRREVATTYLKARRHPRLTVHAAQAAADFEKTLPAGQHDEIHLWEGAGHFLHQERSEAFNRLLLDWLGRSCT
jgi:pimeloyl-ACP methyl ester carboxylesterase